MTSIQLLSDGTFKLDGGAMHGVVPMPLWEKINPPDEKNRILLGLNSLLVETAGAKILVEAGIGTGHGEKFASLFCINKNRSIIGDLQSLKISPEEISIVIPTHLHFDHGGGLADWSTGRLLFPNARIILQKKEWEAAQHPHPKNQASYLPEFIKPLEKANLQLVDGDEEVVPGVRVALTGGHTHGHQAVFLETKNGVVAFLGDLVPTKGHANPLWAMAYDVDPERSISMKKKYLTQGASDKWTFVLVHDPTRPVGQVRIEGGKYRYEPWEGLTLYHSAGVGGPMSLHNVHA